MALSEDSRELDPQTAAAPTPDEQERRALAEEQARRELFHVWHLPTGHFPLLTLLIVLTSAAATGLAAFARAPVYEALYATPTELWVRCKWWGVFGSVFLHGDVAHVFFNCYWIWFLGRVLESKIGLADYLAFFLATAWFSSLAQFAWSGQLGIGLSGVVYAVFGYLVVNRSQHADYDRVLSGNTIPLFLGWLIVCFPLTYWGILNVGNAAHVGGLLAGCALGALALPHPRRRLARRAAVGLGLISFLPLVWAPWFHPWHTAQVLRAINRKNSDATLASFTSLRTKYPDDHWALEYEASLRFQKGQYVTARDLLDRAVSDDTPTPILLNSLAWLLATCPSAEVRNGPRAVELARRACEETRWKNGAVIDTLAAAYAETGDFPQAEIEMEKALTFAGKNVAALEEHLAAFRAHQPWREPTVPPSDKPKPR
jgi:membrane associated rhomboid family serine protease